MSNKIKKAYSKVCLIEKSHLRSGSLWVPVLIDAVCDKITALQTFKIKFGNHRPTNITIEEAKELANALLEAVKFLENCNCASSNTQIPITPFSAPLDTD